MKTALLKLGRAQPEDATRYPLELCFDDGSNTWRQNALAKAWMEPTGTSSGPALKVPDRYAGGGDGEVEVALDNIRKVYANPDLPQEVQITLGQYLHRLAFPKPIVEEWKLLRAKHAPSAGGSAGLRTILQIDEPSLRPLPWELLWEEPAKFLFLDSSNPVLRSPLNGRPFEHAADWPLRCSVVIGFAPGPEMEEAQKELEGIRAALWTLGPAVDLEVLEGPSRDQLTKHVTGFKPHVFHVISHGRIDARGAFVEIFNPAGIGETWDWRPEDISMVLGSWKPSLTFLNCCHTSTASELLPHSLADIFLHEGVQAVVAMQDKVPHDAASVFGARLYERLAHGDSLDVALVQARIAVHDRPAGVDKAWSIATLHTASLPAGPILGNERHSQDDRSRAANDEYLRPNFSFVNRSTERRDLLTRLRNGKQRSGLFVVQGDPHVGKSRLLLYSLASTLLAGGRVKYVDFGRPRTSTALGALRAVRDSSGSKVVGKALSEEAFRAFNSAVRCQAAGKLPPSDEVCSVPVDDDPMLELTQGDDRVVERVFEIFRKALLDVARRARAETGLPFVLVLDHMHSLEGTGGIDLGALKQFFVPHLFQPLAEEFDCDLLLIVSLVDAARKQIGMAGMNPLPELFPLQPLPATEWELLAREFSVKKRFAKDLAESFIAPLCQVPRLTIVQRLEILAAALDTPEGQVP